MPENESPDTQIKEESKKQPAKKPFCKRLCGIWPIRCVIKDKPIVTVLRLAGVIGETGGFKKGLTLNDLDEDITKAFSVGGVKAVAVHVNSPGGSPVQSELIFNRIRSLSEEKEIPVYTFAEDVAASGGYWLACAGDKIYASQSSIIGSIGVISAGFGFEAAIKKLGVERRVYSQGENKSILDPFQKEKPEDIKILNAAQKDVHDAFKALVRDRRHEVIKKSKEKQLFSGEFWSGQKALELGLVDEINDMRSVMQEKFGKDVHYVKISKPQGWLKRKLSMSVGGLIDGTFDSLNQRALWARFGL